MILYLTYDGLTDPLGQSQILPYLIGLADKGHQIHIVSFEKKERFIAGQRHIQSLISEQKNITWQPLHYTSSPPLLSTIFDLWKLRRKVKRLLGAEKIDIVHCRSYPTTFSITQLIKKSKAKLIFDMRGLYIDERFDGNIWNEKSFFWKKLKPRLKRKEIEVMNSADIIISLTETGKEEIVSWPAFTNTEIAVIPCTADTAHFNHLYNPVDPLKLVYLGSIGTWYMLDEMLLFFKEMLKTFPNAEFHFLTMDDPEIVMSKSAQIDIAPEHIKIYSRKREDLPKSLSEMDIAISFIKPLYSKKASSPTKMAELLSMGIPIICNGGIGDLDQLGFENPDFVRVVALSQYSHTISSIPQMLTYRKTKQDEIRSIALSHFNLQSGVAKYDQIYHQLIGDKL